MSDTVKAKLAHFGAENLEPGDILLTNDAYITGSHLNHMSSRCRSSTTLSWLDFPAAWRIGRMSAAR